MKEQIFIDTGAFYSKLDKKDRDHKTSIELWPKIIKDYQPVTTNYIFEESLTLIRRKIGIEESILFANFFLKTDAIQIYEIDKTIRNDALNIFKKFTDKNFSFTDCTSFAFMVENKIKSAFSFDKHFEQMGFIAVYDFE